MTGRRDLIAILSGGGAAPGGFRCRQHAGFTAVFGSGCQALWKRTNRRAILNGAVQRQRDLETLMQHGTVLPVLPGTRLEPERTDLLILANAGHLADLAGTLRDRIQFQVSVTWSRRDAPARFGWHDDASVERGANGLARRLADALDEVVEERIELPRQPDMLLNAAVLLRAVDEERLDAALEKADAIWPEGLSIRQVGPSPAVSFASLGLREIAPAAVRAARAALSLAPDADAGTIRAARRRALMAAPPETRPAIMEAARLAEAACRVGRDRFPQAYTWREGLAAVDDDRRKVA